MTRIHNKRRVIIRNNIARFRAYSLPTDDLQINANKSSYLKYENTLRPLYGKKCLSVVCRRHYFMLTIPILSALAKFSYHIRERGRSVSTSATCSAGYSTESCRHADMLQKHQTWCLFLLSACCQISKNRTLLITISLRDVFCLLKSFCRVLNILALEPPPEDRCLAILFFFGCAASSCSSNTESFYRGDTKCAAEGLYE